MRLNVRRLTLFALVPLGLVACQNEPPAFVEQGVVPIALTVSETGGDNGTSRGNEFIIEDEDEETRDAEARADSKILGYSSYVGDEETAEGDNTDADADATAEADEAQDEKPESKAAVARDTAQPQETPVKADNAAAIAAACGRHLKGFASKIVVISADEALSSLNIGPDTALAVRLTGNQSRLSLSLGAGQPLAGICFVMRGHESSAQFTTASDVKKLVYLAAGDQSKGELQWNDGAALGAARIELTGHAPSLSLSGVSATACNGALLKNKSARVQCSP